MQTMFPQPVPAYMTRWLPRSPKTGVAKVLSSGSMPGVQNHASSPVRLSKA